MKRKAPPAADAVPPQVWRSPRRRSALTSSLGGIMEVVLGRGTDRQSLCAARATCQTLRRALARPGVALERLAANAADIISALPRAEYLVDIRGGLAENIHLQLEDGMVRRGARETFRRREGAREEASATRADGVAAAARGARSSATRATSEPEPRTQADVASLAGRWDQYRRRAELERRSPFGLIPAALECWRRPSFQRWRSERERTSFEHLAGTSSARKTGARRGPRPAIACCGWRARSSRPRGDGSRRGGAASRTSTTARYLHGAFRMPLHGLWGGIAATPRGASW